MPIRWRCVGIMASLEDCGTRVSILYKIDKVSCAFVFAAIKNIHEFQQEGIFLSGYRKSSEYPLSCLSTMLGNGDVPVSG